MVVIMKTIIGTILGLITGTILGLIPQKYSKSELFLRNMAKRVIEKSNLLLAPTNNKVNCHVENGELRVGHKPTRNGRQIIKWKPEGVCYEN